MFEVKGGLDFQVKGLGTGSIVVTGGSKGLSFKGSFDAQSDFFSKFNVTIAYDSASKKLSGGGDIAVAKDKIAGVSEATANVTVDADKWEATGKLVPKIKAIKDVTIGAKHVAGQGFTFTGKATLGSIPGVSGGEVDMINAIAEARAAKAAR